MMEIIAIILKLNISNSLQTLKEIQLSDEFSLGMIVQSEICVFLLPLDFLILGFILKVLILVCFIEYKNSSHFKLSLIDMMEVLIKKFSDLKFSEADILSEQSITHALCFAL